MQKRIYLTRLVANESTRKLNKIENSSLCFCFAQSITVCVSVCVFECVQEHNKCQIRVFVCETQMCVSNSANARSIGEQSFMDVVE